VDATVAIATYGDESWQRLATERARPSAEAQGVPVVQVHLTDGTLAQARNAALEQVDTEFVIFLDADDELSHDYVHWMSTGTADLRAPAIAQYRYGQLLWPSFMPNVYRHRHQCVADCLRVGNWLVIGACARTEIVYYVGGFEEFPWSEDWQLWAKCWKAGATVEPIHRAVYRAHLSQNGRNHQHANATIARIHREIELSVWGDLVDPRTHPERAGE
jgi:hypothetical protein